MELLLVKIEHDVNVPKEQTEKTEDFASREICEQRVQILRLEISLRFFQSSSLEKRIYGLTEIVVIITRLYNDQIQEQADPTAASLFATLDYLVNWMHEKQLMQELLGEKMHVELIKRSTSLFQFVSELERLTRRSLVQFKDDMKPFARQFTIYYWKWRLGITVSDIRQSSESYVSVLLKETVDYKEGVRQTLNTTDFLQMDDEKRSKIPILKDHVSEIKNRLLALRAAWILDKSGDKESSFTEEQLNSVWELMIVDAFLLDEAALCFQWIELFKATDSAVAEEIITLLASFHLAFAPEIRQTDLPFLCKMRFLEKCMEFIATAKKEAENVPESPKADVKNSGKLATDVAIKMKINDFMEFPMEIDMFPYTSEALAATDRGKINDKRIIHETGNPRWLEFNDEIVREFDVETMGEECFGGEEVAQKWNAIQGT
ncbi:hypothetical protein JG687_00007900 [Phytophthora cactorum]|uniref:UBP34/UBP24/USP9X/USP9Y-like ARM repeat region domain-containing protein n=1 Tax=Phytophthora cactorum TaxID=29920 RepID=A0A8T1UH06_9STRA|nr:hypothetical protein JG687_00007900 [Phytophthora cactorum]